MNDTIVTDRWTIEGVEFANCNCDWGCPCQFNSKTTHGHCEAIAGGRIDTGHFNDVSLDGLCFALLLKWPGEVAEGDGQQQVIIDERADEAQRQALGKILHGESTAPGGTHFFVYNSTMSRVWPTRYEKIELDIDIEERKARIVVPDLILAEGSPIISPITGEPTRSRIELPNGFEYTVAEMGNGTSRSTGDIEITLNDSYGQFNKLHMNQDGVIR